MKHLIEALRSGWRAVPGYEGIYSVNALGEVRNDKRRRLLRPALMSGYPSVGLCRDGKRYCVGTARLVLLAFVGPRPAGMQCCHNDGDKLNSTLGNLRYDTPTGNAADKAKHGTAQTGERNPYSRLTARAVRAIRADKRVSRLIAAEYGVSGRTVRQIKSGDSWRSLS